jgi:hypothetical protein
MSEDRDLDLALEEAFLDLHQDFSAKLAKAPRGQRVEITGRFELRHSSGEVITGRVDLVRQPAGSLRRNGWART